MKFEERAFYIPGLHACCLIPGKINNTYQGTFAQSTDPALPDPGPELVPGLPCGHGLEHAQAVPLVEGRPLPVLIPVHDVTHAHSHSHSLLYVLSTQSALTFQFPTVFLSLVFRFPLAGYWWTQIMTPDHYWASFIQNTTGASERGQCLQMSGAVICACLGVSASCDRLLISLIADWPDCLCPGLSPAPAACHCLGLGTGHEWGRRGGTGPATGGCTDRSCPAPTLPFSLHT